MALRALPLPQTPLSAARVGVSWIAAHAAHRRRRHRGDAVTADELSHFRARLLALKAALDDEGPIKLDPNRTDDIGKRDDDHQPLNEMLQSIASSRNRNRTDELRRIEAALQRIDRDPDDYGLCMECEEPIRRRRLELMPAVELCVKCQSAQESDRPAGRRNHLTDYI